MDDDLREWVAEIGSKHGFTPPAQERPPSSDPRASFEALDGEAHELYARAGRMIDALRSIVPAGEYRDLINRINSFHGRLRDPANAGNAQELRRVITDLRELVSDLEARMREGGAAGRGGGATGPTPGQPSDRADASFEDLERQARALFGRANALLEETRLGISTAEYRELSMRINTFNGRVHDPALRGDVQEMRRIVSDLYATLQDLERRSRELERATDGTIGELAAGRFGRPDPPRPDGPGRDPGQAPSVDPDASFEALDAEAHELHERATNMLDRIAQRLPERERRDHRDRLNTIYGRLRDENNQGDARELRRVITDLRALVQDLRSRTRELGGPH